MVGQKDVERGGIVHRLDKDTSGVCILKTQSAYESLKQFADHTIIKIYYCSLWEDTGQRDYHIYRTRSKRKQAMKAAVYPTGLERGSLRSATRYRKIKTYA